MVKQHDLLLYFSIRDITEKHVFRTIMGIFNIRKDINNTTQAVPDYYIDVILT
jgi:hypothetical protein